MLQRRFILKEEILIRKERGGERYREAKEIKSRLLKKKEELRNFELRKRDWGALI